MAVVASVSPLTARRRLGAALHRLRDQHGLTTEEVGAHLNCHNSKVSRIENAKRGCTKKDFEGLMELFAVKEPLLSELTSLMVKGRQRVPPWWHAFSDVISLNYAEFIAYEAEAVESFEYQSVLIPGLLQTDGYARAVTGIGISIFDPDQVDNLVEVRMRRQERLREEEPLILNVVLAEAALRTLVGGTDVMRGQLRHLLDVSALDNVRVRIIPFQAGERGLTTGTFLLFNSGMGRDSEADVAFTDSAENTAVYRDDPLALKRLSRLFTGLSRAALPEDDSRQLIEDIEKELDRNE
ncbi:helix-turn-helix domain-containing protein [Streptomyces corynorhini]|uniref:XRE family transcriptional regulator n=1 Tax=Streptomyces corynorhini TaxID=2282652 RepID=A0A370B5C0_9ACTN|nr:helix-turn-helix transcriptional regulator [Streptomyces corynorhini]RDG35063.1 XRE family transcriptional regulator [Streptomyces corynorhini]